MARQRVPRRAFHAPPPTRRAATLAASLTAQPKAGHPVSSNSPRWSGPRLGGRIKAWGSAAFASRWARIFSITTGSSMQARIRTAPPQAGQIAMSMPKTRLRRCAQVMATRRSAGVGSSGSRFVGCRPPLPRLAGGHPRAVFPAGRKYAVETCQIDARFGHQGRQQGDDIERLEDDVRRTGAVRRLPLPMPNRSARVTHRRSSARPTARAV